MVRYFRGLGTLKLSMQIRSGGVGVRQDPSCRKSWFHLTGTLGPDQQHPGMFQKFKMQIIQSCSDPTSWGLGLKGQQSCVNKCAREFCHVSSLRTPAPEAIALITETPGSYQFSGPRAEAEASCLVRTLPPRSALHVPPFPPTPFPPHSPTPRRP